MLVALVVDLIALAATGRFESLGPVASSLPVLAVSDFVAPVWSWPACAQLVVPLAITVTAVQNGQGAAVLTVAGHRPPMKIVTVLCGVRSVLAAPLGAISTCLAGPTNALLTVVGDRHRQYIAGMACGVLAIGVGLNAPMLAPLLTIVPTTFIAALAGLAMLEALRGAFVGAFGRHIQTATSRPVDHTAGHDFGHSGRRARCAVLGTGRRGCCHPTARQPRLTVETAIL